jgi:3-oxoacyl-[acyl-carrier-protein] synthase-3
MRKEQIVSNVDELGNTSAASIPLALWQAILRKQVTPPATCALVGFGGGLTWGAAVIRWTAKDARLEHRLHSHKEETSK